MLIDPAGSAPNPLARLEEARQILLGNDRGGYTVPSAALYPFQWNWDSAVVAVGWMEIDEARAWQELESLTTGQWENGLIPHILFHKPSATYFPGPEEWGLADRPIPTSSISQPPVLASMAKRMLDQAKDRSLALSRVKALIPSMVAWHRWWYRDRDPEQTGLAVMFHPWESGMDNSPSWDQPLSAVPQTSRPYRRKDTSHVPAVQRPNQSDYDRFVYLLDLFRELKFNAEAIYERCPFRTADFALNAILLRATRDLKALCQQAGFAGEATEMEGLANRAHRALLSLWSDSLGQFISVDTRGGHALTARTNATFLAWYAGLLDASNVDSPMHQRLIASLDEWLGSVRFGLPTTHPKDPAFNPVKYWRGPVWPHINWLIGLGLAEAGQTRNAEKLRSDTLALIQAGGLREYFNPHTGEGIGGERFSWTAAILLTWSRGTQIPRSHGTN